MSRRSTFFPGGLALVLIVFLIGTALAQIPDTFENLEVFPKDISKRDLVSSMRGFAGALGQRCSYCHVGGADPNSLEGMDFASDEKEHKRTARAMMKMMNDINQNHIANLEEESPLQVQCITCHRGVQKPEAIEDLLMGIVISDGVEAATAKYAEMRKTYYGSGSYNFGSGPLNTLAEQLASRNDLEGAVAVMKMNLALNPDESYPHILLGQIHAQNGDKEAAIASMERALEIEPDNEWAKKMLERVRSME